MPQLADRQKKRGLISQSSCFRAENETRTRDPNLGKVVLYQLSYFRILINSVGILTTVKTPALRLRNTGAKVDKISEYPIFFGNTFKFFDREL